MAKRKLGISEGEWEIMNVVWAREPCTAPDVTEALEKSKGWAYSTVRTMMDRMVAKGLLKSDKIRHMDLYRSAISRQKAQKGELLGTLKRAFNDALTPMLQCLLEARELSMEEMASSSSFSLTPHFSGVRAKLKSIKPFQRFQSSVDYCMSL